MKVKSDTRVKILERTNIRSIPNESFTQKFDIVVADLSFISLTAVMKNILDLARDDGSIILLVKPQFEATKTEASKSKGVINDSSIWLRTITKLKIRRLSLEAMSKTPQCRHCQEKQETGSFSCSYQNNYHRKTSN